MRLEYAREYASTLALTLVLVLAANLSRDIYYSGPCSICGEGMEDCSSCRGLWLSRSVLHSAGGRVSRRLKQ